MTFLENVDKTKLQKITLIVISALVLTALALLLVIILMSITPKTPGLSAGLSDLKDYTVTDADIKTGTLLLADDQHSYTPDKTLVEFLDCKGYRNEYLKGTGMTEDQINNKKDPDRFKKLKYMPYDNMALESEAMKYAHEMLIDATNALLAEHGAITVDAAYGRQENIKTHLQEFNTGLLIFLSDERSDAGARIELPAKYREWFDANAYKYGFIESFEDGYRYVGAPHAKLIHDNEDISNLADYIEFLKENTGYDKTVRVKIGTAEYAIYYVECKAGDTIKAPKDLANTTISGTNEGGVIVTVKLSK